jgi:hypothetical protein
MAPSTVLSMQRAACAASAFPRPISPNSRPRCGPAFSTSISTAYSTNFLGVLHCTHAVLPRHQARARSSVSRRAAACTAGRERRYILPPKPQSSCSVNRLPRKSAGTAFGSTQSRPATPRRAGKSTSLCAVRLAARRPAMMPGGRSLSSLATPTTSPAAASTFVVARRYIETALRARRAGHGRPGNGGESCGVNTPPRWRSC